MQCNRTPFGRIGSSSVDLYVLRNGHGLEASLTTYGATLVSMKTPDAKGRLQDVTLGFGSLDGYLGNNPFFGCTVGRVANRISGARFLLEGREYRMAANDGPNCLHGGLKGLDKRVWSAKETAENDSIGIEFRYSSPDGDEGFPGTVDVTVIYLLTEANELRIRYAAKTDKVTVLNLTNHAYWNLRGEGNGDVLDHVLKLSAELYTPSGSGLIPTGEIAPVAGTPLDFTKPMAIGSRIKDEHPQLKVAGGYDHNFVIKRPDKSASLVLAAEVFEPETRRVMEVLTTEPGVQLYSGNFLDGSITGKSGKTYGKRSGLCLETQHYPDSPNRPEFPSVVLKPGLVFSSETVHRFSVR